MKSPRDLLDAVEGYAADYLQNTAMLCRITERVIQFCINSVWS